MVADENSFVVRLPRRLPLMSLIVLLAVVALAVATMLPSFVITLELENATAETVTVSVVRVGTNEAAACTLKPGETKRIKLFSGDGRDPENWIYLGTVVNDSGAVLRTRRMTWREFRATPWRIDSPATATAPRP
jgi:hypothetical protein